MCVIFNVFGEAIQIRCPSRSKARAENKTSSIICFVVDFIVVADLPYGGSVTMQSTFVMGGMRASAITTPSGSMRKCFRFFRHPFVMRRWASKPNTRQPMNAASIIVLPVPQNGSITNSPVFACAKFTMHRASLEGMADGWKKGFFLGRLSTKGLGAISASLTPKTSFSLVKIPMKVL